MAYFNHSLKFSVKKEEKKKPHSGWKGWGEIVMDLRDDYALVTVYVRCQDTLWPVVLKTEAMNEPKDREQPSRLQALESKEL